MTDLSSYLWVAAFGTYVGRWFQYWMHQRPPDCPAVEPDKETE